MSKKEIDGEGLSLLVTLCGMVKLLTKVYVGALATLIYVVDASRPSCCGGGLGKLMVDGGSSFGERDDE